MWVLTLGRRDAHVSAVDSVKVLEQSTLDAPSMTIDRLAIRTRMRDPGLTAAPSVDPATVRVMFEYVAWATAWLLVGTTAGLIASIKLHWPEFLPFAWLSFGRVRPTHTNVVLLGWSSLVMVGLALYVVSRTSRVPLWSPR